MWHILLFFPNSPVYDEYPGASLCLVTQSCPTVCDPMNCSPQGSSVHVDSPSKNTGVGCHALLQGIFPTQGLNLGLLHCRQILYQLSYPGSPEYPWSNGNWVGLIIERWGEYWASLKYAGNAKSVKLKSQHCGEKGSGIRVSVKDECRRHGVYKR